LSTSDSSSNSEN